MHNPEYVLFYRSSANEDTYTPYWVSLSPASLCTSVVDGKYTEIKNVFSTLFVEPGRFSLTTKWYNAINARRSVCFLDLDADRPFAFSQEGGNLFLLSRHNLWGLRTVCNGAVYDTRGGVTNLSGESFYVRYRLYLE